MQLECVHMKMWHYVGIYVQWYYFQGKICNGDRPFQVQTALKPRKASLYEELHLINDTFDKIQIPAEEIACL